MDYRLMFPTKYLKAADLKGKDVVVTIRHVVAKEEMESAKGKENRPMLYFEETKAASQRDKTDEKRLVLNSTNGKTIAGLFGKETDNWIGKRITLTTAMVDAWGEMKEAIRVSPIAPPQATTTETTTTKTES